MKTWATESASLSLDGSVNGAAVKREGEFPSLTSGRGYRGTP